jgi:oxygen-independent coproporphyrinogen-3 oxidase
MELPPLGLYVHLPWCERKCPYCDFNSHETREIPEQAYIDALLHDLEGDLTLVSGREIQTLFIGGGTPSLFSPTAIGRLLRGIGCLVPLGGQLEATIEANPGSAEAEKFAGFRAAEINRLSLGVQSFEDRQLQALGRVHDSAQARAALGIARAAGFDSLNIDLMHGLPGQTSASALDDLHAALGQRPTHLSWYQLTIEPNTVFYKKPPALPVEDVLADIQDAGERLLMAAGYRQYEVSAWCLPGFECRHNLNYWQFGDYLGIGAGAHAKLTRPDGTITRYAKRRQPGDYMAAENTRFTAEERVLGEDDILGEFILNALRLNRGFSRGLFTCRTGLEPTALEPQLSQFCRQGLLEQDDRGIRATKLGRRFLDTVVAAFFPEESE